MKLSILALIGFGCLLLSRLLRNLHLISLLLTLNRSHTLFYCFHCWFWTGKFRQSIIIICQIWKIWRWRCQNIDPLVYRLTCNIWIVRKSGSFFPFLLHLVLFQNSVTKALKRPFPANISLFKVNNRNSRERCEVCWKLPIKTIKTLLTLF